MTTYAQRKPRHTITTSTPAPRTEEADPVENYVDTVAKPLYDRISDQTAEIARLRAALKEVTDSNAENAKLRAALIEAIDCIKTWHNMGVFNEALGERMWQTYQNSPEMKRINAALEGKAEPVKYRMVLDFGRPCPKCGNEASVLITSDASGFPTFHFCGCEHPTFTLTQDNVGDVPSFARANFDEPTF